jgi:drug/metabolite transporter superfamily protein YnfA
MAAVIPIISMGRSDDTRLFATPGSGPGVSVTQSGIWIVVDRIFLSVFENNGPAIIIAGTEIMVP